MDTPHAPNNLVATTIDHQSVGLTWVDNSADVAGINEIQHITFDNVPEAGTFTLTFDGETTTPIAYDADAATVQAALEATASFEVGDVSVTTITGGYAIEFTGGLAAMNVDPITVDDAELKQDASTITVTVVQSGIADVNEEQRVDLGGATTGTFDLSGNSTSATVSTLDASGIQSACDTIWGSGNTTVSSLGGDLFSVTFQNSFAATNVGEMTISDNSTDGSPSVSTYTGGVAGRVLVIEYSLPDGPTEGRCGLYADLIGSTGDWSFDASASAVEFAVETGPAAFNCSVTGSAGGPWTITSDDKFNSSNWAGTEIEPLRKPCGMTVTTDTQGSPQGWAEIGFYIERSPDGSANWTQIVDLGANLESWDDTGLAANTEFFWRIKAYNAGGQSSWSNTDSATTDAEPGGASSLYSETTITIGVSI